MISCNTNIKREDTMIRKLDAYSDDVCRVMKIWRRSTIEAHSFIEESYWIKNYNTVRDEYIPIAETYVYQREKRIVGFISIIDKSYIGALFIDVDYQGQGIGSILLDYAKSLYGSLRLAVYSKNDGAVCFYTKSGFITEKTEINKDTMEEEYIMIYQHN